MERTNNLLTLLKKRKTFHQLKWVFLPFLIFLLAGNSYSAQTASTITLKGSDFPSLGSQHEISGTYLRAKSFIKVKDLEDEIILPSGFPAVWLDNNSSTYALISQGQGCGNYDFNFSFPNPAMVTRIEVAVPSGANWPVSPKWDLQGKKPGGDWIYLVQSSDQIPVYVPAQKRELYKDYKLTARLTSYCDSYPVSEIRLYGTLSSQVPDFTSVSSPLDMNLFLQLTQAAAKNLSGYEQDSPSISIYTDSPSSYPGISFLIGDGSRWYYYNPSSSTWEQTDLLSIPAWLKGMPITTLKNIPSQALDNLKNTLSSWQIAAFITRDTNNTAAGIQTVSLSGMVHSLSADDIPLEVSSSAGFAPVTVDFNLGKVSYFPQTMVSYYGVDFGDGLSSENLASWSFPLTLSHEYQNPGTYQAKVTVRLTDNQAASRNLNLSISPRAPASFELSSQNTNPPVSFTPVKYQFSAKVKSDDLRNKTLSPTGVTWTVKKQNNEVVATFPHQPDSFSYEFPEGNTTYLIQAQATSPIGTLITGELNLTTPKRALASLPLTIKCDNSDRSTGKAYFPTTCRVIPKSLSSDDPRNRKITAFTVKVFDLNDNLIQEVSSDSLSPAEVSFNRSPGEYRIEAAALTGIGTQAKEELSLKVERVPVSAKLTLRANDNFAPTTLRANVDLGSEDSRNKTLREESFLIYRKEGENQSLLATLTPSPSGKLTYSFLEGGEYKILYQAISSIGSLISAEAQLSLKERAPVASTIKARCLPGNPGLAPVSCNFSAALSSSDRRSTLAQTSLWEIYKGEELLARITEGKIRQYVFTEPGIYRVKYLPTVETGTEVEGEPVVITVYDSAPVGVNLDYTCRPEYAPASCRFELNLATGDKRDRMINNCKWQFFRNEELFFATNPEEGCLTTLRKVLDPGGNYRVLLTGETTSGKPFSGEAAIGLSDHKPISLQIQTRYYGSNRPPVKYRIFTGLNSEDRRQKLEQIHIQVTDSEGNLIGESKTPSLYQVFQAPGTYTVLAQALSRLGDTAEACTQITINPNQPPVISQFNLTPTRTEPLKVKFSARADDRDGKVTGYTWDMGDGKQEYVATGYHTYGSPGTYLIKVTACDDSGECSTEERTLRVD